MIYVSCIHTCIYIYIYMIIYVYAVWVGMLNQFFQFSTVGGVHSLTKFTFHSFKRADLAPSSKLLLVMFQVSPIFLVRLIGEGFFHHGVCCDCHFFSWCYIQVPKKEKKKGKQKISDDFLLPKKNVSQSGHRTAIKFRSKVERVIRYKVSHGKKKQLLLSNESWLVNRDSYFMVYEIIINNPYI